LHRAEQISRRSERTGKIGQGSTIRQTINTGSQQSRPARPAAGRAEQSREGQSRAEQEGQQEQRQTIDLGEGVPGPTTGGMNRASDSKRRDAVAKIASPPQFPTPTPQNRNQKIQQEC